MKKGIVIATSFQTRDWLPDCIISVGNKYPITVVSNDDLGIDESKYRDCNCTFVHNDWNGFEFGAIARGMELYDEFIFLPDTILVKDNSIFDKMFEHDGSVYLSQSFFHYIGKYNSEILRKIGVPKIYTKDEAIKGEYLWTPQYLREDPKAILFQPELPVLSEQFQIMHGRNNMVVQNDFIIKFKATWQ